MNEYTMIVEQTRDYPKRMRYDPATEKFCESAHVSIGFARNFTRPYGWLKETGTPPGPHWDVILMSDGDYALGEELAVRIIGVFKRGDGDHKMIAVTLDRSILDFSELDADEKAALSRLYPRVGSGEGWFDKEEAARIMRECEKPL